MNNLQIKVLIGISGAGKSTWASNFIKTNPNWARVNRDSIREQLTGLKASEYNQKPNSTIEKLVSDIQHENVRYLLNKDWNVIIDNTHLSEKYINEIRNLYDHLANIELVFINTDLATCTQRIIERDNTLEVTYLAKQFSRYKEIYCDYNEAKKGFFKSLVTTKKDYTYKPNKYKPIAVVCDIDGTLADNVNRDPYDVSKAGSDKIIPAVANVLFSLHDTTGTKIIFLSGREEKYRAITEDWISENFGEEDETFSYSLFMRPTGDNRRDSIIKMELFNTRIAPFYNVVAVFDDRLRVLEECWEKLGIFRFNVNQTNKRF